MAATRTDTTRDEWLTRLLSTPASCEGFATIRAALIASPPTAGELAALREVLATWSPRVGRFAPIEWLWRASRGEACPELSLCNAVDPDWLVDAPAEYEHERYEFHDAFEGVDHETSAEEEAYIDRLMRDEAYIDQQLSIDASAASSREGGPDHV
jgi:hypothetical protein